MRASWSESGPARADAQGPPSTLVYLLGAFLSAFASFQIQPLMTKLILPWFGGGPWVWAICLVFYQSLLVVGYVYSHFLATVLPLRLQVGVHSVLLATGTLVLLVHQWAWPLAILPGASWHPNGGNPTLAILSILAASVGLPYFLLSATSPLLQRWFVTARPESPYPLWAMSNFGSLAGLLSYPLVVEPALDAGAQSFLWVGLFVSAAAACALAGFATLGAGSSAPDGPEAEETERPSAQACLKWFVYSSIPSALLVSTTTQITETVAPVPLLFVAPLSLYLLTLILAFRSGKWRRPSWIHLFFAVSAFAASTALSPWGALLDAPQTLCIYCSALFFGAYSLHCEMARSRPAPRHLTLYYVAISFGGALGGAIVSLGAPLVFRDFFEFHVSLFACASALVVALLLDEDSWLRRHKRWVALAPVAAMLALPGRLGLYWLRPALVRAGSLQVAALFATFAAMGFLALHDRRRTAPAGSRSLGPFLVALLLAPLGVSLVNDAVATHHDVLAQTRSFYGVLTVAEANRGQPDEALILQDGVTIHGLQLKDPARRDDPTSFYHPDTGVSHAFAALRAARSGGPLNVGVIGLGAGTLAAYGSPGDRIRFYELDPNDVRLAWQYFTFLKGSGAAVRVREGDGRLLMQEEVDKGEPGEFDLLVLDAFNGDTVPVHLLTAEAFALYRKRLKGASSAIAVNISSRYLNLEPVIAAAAAHVGLRADVTSSTDRQHGRHAVTWAILSEDPAFLEASRQSQTHSAERRESVRLWTDRYSDIVSLLRW